MTDFDRLRPDQNIPAPETDQRAKPVENIAEPATEAARGLRKRKRSLKLLAVLTFLPAALIVVILVLMLMTPKDDFFLHFQVKAEPLEDTGGWFLIRPDDGAKTELFTLAMARAAESVHSIPDPWFDRPETSSPADQPGGPADSKKISEDQGTALIMVGCVEGQVMPPTFAFSQLVSDKRDNLLPHPPKPCAFSYRIDDSEELPASCIFDGIVASLVHSPGPYEHLHEPGRALLNSAGQGRRLTVYFRVETGQALSANFDVSQLALAQVRLQRECVRPGKAAIEDRSRAAP